VQAHRRRGIRREDFGGLADVTGASTADGPAVIQWSANNGANQQWQLVAA